MLYTGRWTFRFHYYITPAGQGGPKGSCVQEFRSNRAILHKSCNLAQILQSPKSEFVTCVMLSTHTNTSLIKPHLTELDEINRNRPKSNYNLAKNLQSWSVTSDIRHTDIGQTEIHTFFIWYPRVGREHNSPSGNYIVECFLFIPNRLSRPDNDLPYKKYFKIEERTP